MRIYQLIARIIAYFARFVWHGSGQTWPGEVVLKLNPKIAIGLRKYFSRVILVVGTNGKTSTAKFIVDSLNSQKIPVITNSSGANLLNGVVSSILLQLPLKSAESLYTGVFEVDEYSFSKIAQYFKPEYVIMLNLFRDQLDRYGEIENILSRFKEALKSMKNTKFIYLASDPFLYFLLKPLSAVKLPYVVSPALLGKNQKVMADVTNCSLCQQKLVYTGYYLGHIGAWQCSSCHLSPAKNSFTFTSFQLGKLSKLPNYMQINLAAVYLLLKQLKVPESVFWQTVGSWQPAYGRGERYQNSMHDYSFYLGKNPSSWTITLGNLSKDTLINSELILGLNNQIPDGHDVSWIWDTKLDISKLSRAKISVFGDRAYDLAIRLKTEGILVANIFLSRHDLLKYLNNNKTKKVIFVCNYSALLQARKLIIGRSIKE